MPSRSAKSSDKSLAPSILPLQAVSGTGKLPRARAVTRIRHQNQGEVPGGSQPHRHDDHRRPLCGSRSHGASFRTTAGTDKWHTTFPRWRSLFRMAGAPQCTTQTAKHRDHAQNRWSIRRSEMAIRAIRPANCARYRRNRDITQED